MLFRSSKSFDSRIVAGKGESAIPYIHIRDLCCLFCKVLEKTEQLPDFDIYNGSPNLSTSHKAIFDISTHYFFGEPLKPIFLPEFLALPGLLFKKFLNLFSGSNDDIFEKVWMIDYIDQVLDVDSSYTQNVLGWMPTPRYHITRRLLFLLEKNKSHPGEWHLKNEAALKRIAKRANFMIYEKMLEQQDSMLTIVNKYILEEDPQGIFNQYKQMALINFQGYTNAIYHLLLAAIRSSDRGLFLEYIDKLAIRRFADGFQPETLCGALKVFNDVIIKNLSNSRELSKIKQEIYDNVGLTLQIAQDEIEDLYDSLVMKMPDEAMLNSNLPDCHELQRRIRQLSAFYQMSPKEFSSTDEIFLMNNMR